MNERPGQLSTEPEQDQHSHGVRFGEAGAMTDFSSRQFPILYPERSTATDLAVDIQRIDVVDLCREYDLLRKAAPSRSARSKRYFVGHDGRPQAKHPASPSEKHLAIALWRLKAQWPRAGGGWLRLLDYQFPLKASRSDTGLGEVDLLGATDQGRLVVIEPEGPAQGRLPWRHSTARSDGGTAIRRRRPFQPQGNCRRGKGALRHPRVRGAADRADSRPRGLVARVVRHGP